MRRLFFVCATLLKPILMCLGVSARMIFLGHFCTSVTSVHVLWFTNDFVLKIVGREGRDQHPLCLVMSQDKTFVSTFDQLSPDIGHTTVSQQLLTNLSVRLTKFIR